MPTSLRRYAAQESKAEIRRVRDVIVELETVGVKEQDLARLLGQVDPITLRRWARGEYLNRLLRYSKFRELADILELAHKAFGEKAIDWFQEPNAALGGVYPYSLLRDPGAGPQQVKQVLINAVSGGVA